MVYHADIVDRNLSVRARWLDTDVASLIHALRMYGQRHPESWERCEDRIRDLEYLYGEDEETGLQATLAGIREILGEVE